MTASDPAQVFSAGAPATPAREKLRKILDAPPPDPKKTSKANLSKIYLERGRAASALDEFDRELKELNDGIQAIGPKDPNSYELHHRLAGLSIDRGDFVAARAAREAALQVAGTSGRRFFQLINLSSISAVLRDRESAKDFLSRAEIVMSTARRGNPEWGRFGDLWQAALVVGDGG